MDILPEEARQFLDRPDQVSDLVAHLLVKLWEHKPLSTREQNTDVTPAEVAAVWSITHQRQISSDTVRQVLRRSGTRGETIAPSRIWGSGAGARRVYRLGDILPVRVQERRMKREGEAV